MHSYCSQCSINLLFSDVPVAVAVVVFLGPVPGHTNPFSNENGAVLLLRIRLSFTLQRKNDLRKRSHSKTLSRVERFENDAFWKRCFLSSDGEHDAIWKRWRHQDTTGGQTTRPWVSKMADRSYYVAFLLIRVVVWTGENDTKTISVGSNLFEKGAKQLRFR